jgi:radical SAM-linked protein
LQDAHKETRRLVCYDCGVACDLSAMSGERLVYLRKLDANEPVVPKPLPPPAATGKGKAPPPRIAQPTARRYRFGYTKIGPSAFLSHLDLIRALPRAFRRLDLPLYYSSGYHPKPEMTFGPALSLGVASTCELVDVKLTCDLDPAAYLEALSAASPDGVRFFGAVRLGDQDAGVSRLIDAARYVVGVPRAVLAPLGGDAWLDAQLARVTREEKLEVVRRIDGVGRKVDVRRFLVGLSRGGEDALATAGIVGDLATFTVDLALPGSGAAKISEVVEVLGADLPHRAVRTALGVRLPAREVASPLDLAAMRTRPSCDTLRACET